MNPAQLIKAAILSVCLLLTSFAYSQTATISYFEASSEYDYGDTSSIVFATAIQNFENADSLSFTLVAGNGQTVYASSNTVAAWKTLAPSRLEGGILYLSVGAGTFSSLGLYMAEARLRSNNGEVLIYNNR